MVQVIAKPVVSTHLVNSIFYLTRTVIVAGDDAPRAVFP